FEEKGKTSAEDRRAQWAHFKFCRASWNLLHELAGAPADRRATDAGDIANDHEEFLLLDKWERGHRDFNEPVLINTKESTLEVPALGANKTFKWSFANEADKDRKLPEKVLLGTLSVEEIKPGPKKPNPGADDNDKPKSDEKEKKTKDDKTLLQGRWYAIEEETEGKALSKDEIATLNKILDVTSDDFRIERGAIGKRVVVEGKMTLGQTNSPKAFDFEGTSPTGQRIELHGIYDVSDSMCKLCYTAVPAGGKYTRPAEFRTSPGSGRIFVTFKRAAEKVEVAQKGIRVDRILLIVENGSVDKLEKLLEGAMSPIQIKLDADGAKDQSVAQKALKTFSKQLVTPALKPAGRLRTWPWFEERGENPYLIVDGIVKSPNEASAVPGHLFQWIFSTKSLVLVEPFVKVLMPIVYLFDNRAAFMDRLYLLFVIIWTLTIWGFFGGAISRIAAVQFAKNERISLGDSLDFAWERFVSYLFAPVAPLVGILIFILLLFLFGWVELIPWFGDVFAGFAWPLVILSGFVMAVILVGLVGWPLMVGTISTEGTDAFDALSRSYSYVYQAPWQYLWYSATSLVYGAAVIFFITFMASLMLFLGKWAVSSTPGLADARESHDRDPSYLFSYAPTSYGWRDLMLSGNTQHVEKKDGHYDFRPEYKEKISTMNTVGAVLVSCWIYPFFLLVVGFSYSFFWTASTIVYFLMRNFVDDTALDVVHQEDDDLDDPFLKMMPPPGKPASAPASTKPGTVSLTIVDGPPSPPPEMPPAPPPDVPAPAPPAPPESSPMPPPPPPEARG
ncbi:MAG: TIGR03067 domain-containing protein, partial [Planctomycetes bacterium]|nr:TIGR03067 domain-containing protein [Planctomycetota bacterium]